MESEIKDSNSLQKLENRSFQITNIILVKIGYSIGLFTVIYFGLLFYDKTLQLNPYSNYTALIIIGIALGISAIDMVLLLKEKLSPAILVAIIYASPIQVLYKIFKNKDLINLDRTILPKRIKYYVTSSLCTTISSIFITKNYNIMSEKLETNENIQGFIDDALNYQEIKKSNEKNKVVDSEDFGIPKIIVFGCGGAGNNTVNRLYNIGLSGAETIALDTDKVHLGITQADKKILIGKSITRGLGAGGFPEIGKRAAELARGTIEEVLKDANLVFIVAGMGGGTGTGAATVVAQVAKDQGAIVIGMVTNPFKVERSRMIKAEEGLDELRRVADTVIVLDNNRLLNYAPNLPIDKAFSIIDQMIAETVKGITEAITQPSLININYADMRSIMKTGGLAVLLVGEAKGQEKATEVARAALNHPLLDIDTKGATGCLIHITGGPDMSIHEAEHVVASLVFELDSHAKVILGARIKKDYMGKIRCVAIITGIKSAQILGSEDNNSLNHESIKQLKSISSRKME